MVIPSFAVDWTVLKHRDDNTSIVIVMFPDYTVSMIKLSLRPEFGWKAIDLSDSPYAAYIGPLRTLDRAEMNYSQLVSLLGYMSREGYREIGQDDPGDVPLEAVEPS